MKRIFDTDKLRSELWGVINDIGLSFYETSQYMRMSHMTLMSFLHDRKVAYYQTLNKIDKFITNRPWEKDDEAE